MSSTKLKTGDKVLVIAGKDKGKEGKILVVDRKKNRVIVEGINMISKHQKPSQMNQQGGIIKKEAFIEASNVMYSLGGGKGTKIGIKIENDKKIRIAKKTGAKID